MKKLLYIIFPALILFISSCKKQKLPAPETNDPKFLFSGEVDHANLGFEAGNNDYYMFSSFFNDTVNKLDVYKAELKQLGCSANCNNALTVLFNDTKLSEPNATMDVETALAPGSRNYNDFSTRPLSFTSTFMPEMPFIAASTYSWIVNDGQTTKVFSTYSINPVLTAGKKYTITLTYFDGGGACQSSHANVYRVGNQLQAGIKATREQPQTDFRYSFSAQTSQTGNLTYLWDFGDGSPLSTQANPSHQFNINSTHYNVKLLLINAAKDTCESYVQVNASPDNDCNSNFSSTIKPVFNPLVFGSVTVILNDANGESYTTSGFLQPAESKFEILERENYEVNNRGESTKKLKLRFNCVVKNGTKSKTITNGQATLAVSYR